MFQSREEIDRRTPRGSLSRLSYLQQLVTEFQTTENQASRREVVANLGNFAYDPMNYEYLRQLNVVDLFLDMLSEEDEKLVEFGVGGLCNLALDREMKTTIIENDGISQVQLCLDSGNKETVLSAITCLMYLMTPSSKPEICSDEVLTKMARFCQSEDRRLLNLAQVFFQDYCTEEERRRYLGQVQPPGEPPSVP